jgi:hypothetical protein
MFIVEFFHQSDGLAKPMGRIRAWLDHERVQPSVFRLSLIPGGTIFRLEFDDVREAKAFARAFEGRVIGDERAAGNVAA